MKNPYKFRQPVVATDLNIPIKKSREKLVGYNGEINASSRKDLANIVASLMEYANNHEILTEEDAASKEKLASLHREMLLAAFESKEHLQTLGETLADELYVASNRNGFCRRFLVRQELEQGKIPVVRMRMKNVVATVASSPSKVETTLVRDNNFYPPEFYITARPYVEKRDIERSNTDILEEKYIEALEAIMVQEDRIWKKMAEATVNVSNPHTNIVGQLTPTSLANFRNVVTAWGIPVKFWLIANDLWSDIIGNNEFMTAIDQVTKHDLLLTGVLGTLLGMTIISDAFRHPQHKVLERGEMYVISDPINHGQYTDRNGIDVQPIDGTHENIPGRGWFLTETISLVIANTRSVARGRRT